MDKRDAQVHVYLTDEERRLLKEEVEAAGVKVSEWVRRAIRTQLGLRVPGNSPLTS